MSEAGIDPANESTKNLVTINRVLWTGISTTNKKLTEQVKALTSQTKEIKNLTTTILTFNKLLYVQMNALTKTQQILTKTTIDLVRELAKVNKAPLYLAGVKTRAMAPGIPGGGGGQLPGMGGIAPFQTFLGHFGKLIKKVNVGNIFGKIEEEAADAKDHISNMFRLLSAKIIGFTGDLSSSQEVSKALLKFVTEYGNKDKEDEKGEEGLWGKSKKSSREFLKGFAKRKFIQAVQSLSNMAKDFIAMGTDPILEGIMSPLKSLGKVLEVILIPLKPFLFLIELIGSVLEAAFAPMEIAMWEGLQDSFTELVGVIPELQQIVQDWIDSGGLTEIINFISNSISNLIDALKNGLMVELLKLSMGILKLAVKIANPETLGLLINIGTMFLKLAEGLGKVLVPILNWLTNLSWNELKGILYGFGIFMATMVGLFTFGLPGMIAGAVIGALALSPILFFQEGGEVPYTGLIYAHQGETVHKEGIDDEILETMEEMVSYQKQILKMKEEKYR